MSAALIYSARKNVPQVLVLEQSGASHVRQLVQRPDHPGGEKSTRMTITFGEATLPVTGTAEILK